MGFLPWRQGDAEFRNRRRGESHGFSADLRKGTRTAGLIDEAVPDLDIEFRADLFMASAVARGLSVFMWQRLTEMLCQTRLRHCNI